MLQSAMYAEHACKEADAARCRAGIGYKGSLYLSVTVHAAADSLSGVCGVAVHAGHLCSTTALQHTLRFKHLLQGPLFCWQIHACWLR